MSDREVGSGRDRIEEIGHPRHRAGVAARPGVDQPAVRLDSPELPVEGVRPPTARPGHRPSPIDPGMTPWIFSRRLREMRGAGLVEKLVDPASDRMYCYRLTPRGWDAVPVMTALAAYGLRHLAPRVFRDGRPRSLGKVFPAGAQEPLLGELLEFARTPSTGLQSGRPAPSARNKQLYA